MSKLLQQYEIYAKAHQAFRTGRKSDGLKATLFLLANGIVKPNARELYQLWESSVRGGSGSDELFFTMLDSGMIPDVLRHAKSGKYEIDRKSVV